VFTVDEDPSALGNPVLTLTSYPIFAGVTGTIGYGIHNVTVTDIRLEEL
jgi:hypothetical protein